MKNLSNKKLLHVALCGILSGTLTGCDSELKQVPITERDWQGPQCSADIKMDLLTGLGAADDIDGLVIFRWGGQLPPQADVVGGAPCSKAVDVTFCESLLSDVTREGLASTLILTSGDDVRVLDGPEAVKEFLGELDSPQKVLLWMHVNNMDIGCDLAQSAVARAGDGQSWYGLYTEMTSSCAPITVDRVEVSIGSNGSFQEVSRVEISRDSNACIGRVPPGTLNIFEQDACLQNTKVGKMFARHAAYEAASVVAFTHLKEELEFYGAPQVLIDKIQLAANDECRHASQVGDLAQRYGCSPDEFTVAPSPVRSLQDIAMDNMIEGCIGETWGALVGLYQAANAEDAQVRETMQQIANDEVGHAALSWEINEWLYLQLSDEARVKLDEEKSQAVARLTTKVTGVARAEFELVAGLPSAIASKTLVAELNKVIGA